MSAYMVDRGHIRYLVHAAVSLRSHRDSPFSYYHDGRRRVLLKHDSMADGGGVTPSELGQILWSENRRSIEARYPDCKDSNDLPGEIGEDWKYSHRPVNTSLAVFRTEPTQVFMSCSCFEYQACETEDWEDSEAHTILDAIRSAAWCMLPGYEKCTWGAPDVFTISNQAAGITR